MIKNNIFLVLAILSTPAFICYGSEELPIENTQDHDDVQARTIEYIGIDIDNNYESAYNHNAQLLGSHAKQFKKPSSISKKINFEELNLEELIDSCNKKTFTIADRLKAGDFNKTHSLSELDRELAILKIHSKSRLNEIERIARKSRREPDYSSFSIGTLLGTLKRASVQHTIKQVENSSSRYSSRTTKVPLYPWDEYKYSGYLKRH